MKKLRILDYFVHGGHQYEFVKTGHTFYLVDPSSLRPNWDVNDRPLLSNVNLITEQEAFRKLYDVVIIRSPINIDRYRPFLKRGAKSVAVVQTTSPYKIPNETKHVVWNCYKSMEKYKYPNKNNYHIVHGFDPNEFKQLHLDKNFRILTVANSFKKRAEIMGYDLWDRISAKLQVCDLIGDGNKDINEKIKKAADFNSLVEIYNQYSVFLNTTKESAMPRSRGEAAMCGMPIVSTRNFDIDKYFTHQKNAILTNDKNEMVSSLKDFLKSPTMCEDYGQAAHEVAMKYFHINDYISKWNEVLENL